MYEARQNKEKVSRVYQMCKQKNINQNLYDSYKGFNYKHDVITQLKWDVNGVNKWLMKDSIGIRAIEDLNKQDYGVMKVRDLKSKRVYSDNQVKILASRGTTFPQEQLILLNDSLTNEEAASTLFHEIVHVNQFANTNNMRQKSRKEIELEAHLKQAEFDLRAGIPPKNPSFATINKQAIEDYVNKIYDLKDTDKNYVSSNVFCKVGLIKPWPYPYPQMQSDER